MNKLILRKNQIPKSVKYNAPQLINILPKNYHVSSKSQSPLIYGGIAIATAAIGLQYAIKYYDSLPQQPNTPIEESPSTSSTADAPFNSASENTKSQAKQTNNTEKTESIFDSWFARSFYDGGFEEKMTRREAALILGVRESSNPDRIKDAHRRILLLNHPDRGGSAYMAAKVNEAKDLLLKGKQ